MKIEESATGHAIQPVLSVPAATARAGLQYEALQERSPYSVYSLSWVLLFEEGNTHMFMRNWNRWISYEDEWIPESQLEPCSFPYS